MANLLKIRSSQSQKQLVKEQISELQMVNPQISLKKSIEFMKKITVVAASSILFLRGIFPADAFSKNKLGGHTVYILQEKDDLYDTKTMAVWLKNAFHLVNSQHLKKLTFVISQGEITLEMYSFSFLYNEDEISCVGEIDGNEVQLSQRLPEDISTSVGKMVRAILIVTTNLQPLPNDWELSIMVVVDENTPPESIPSVFRPSENKLNFPEETQSCMKLGKIETKFNTLTVSSKSALSGVYSSESPTMEEENIMCQAEGEDEVPGSQDELSQLSLSLMGISHLPIDKQEDEHNSELSKTFSVVSKGSNSNTTLSEALSVISLREKKMSCICECDDLVDATILCESCKTHQHKTCYKMLESHKVKTHICVMCHSPDQGKVCSVPDVVNDANRKESALYRQALIFCCNNPRVSCNRIMTHLKVPRRMAEKIIRQLENEDCFELATSKSNIRDVKEGLKESIGHHFNAPISSDNKRMDTTSSPVTLRASRMSASGKRQYEEAKEDYTLTSPTYSAPKRTRMFETPNKSTESYLIDEVFLS